MMGVSNFAPCSKKLSLPASLFMKYHFAAYIIGLWIVTFACCLIVVPALASEPIEFKLAWDANQEEGLDGYEIYFKKGNQGSGYKMIGDVYVE
jgi:hypothetical protein